MQDRENLEELAARSYCVCGADGRLEASRMQKAIDVLRHVRGDATRELPSIDGVPRLRYRIDTMSQIPEAVRRFLPEVERDPRLHALSFVDPLRVANELGIAVSPVVARTVRRSLSGALTFNLQSLDAHGRLRGVGKVRWMPRGDA
jgi:hypothetical protein